MIKKRTRKNNLVKVFKPFINKWVALSLDYNKVISSGNTLSGLMNKLKNKDRGKMIFHKVIPPGYAPNVFV